MTPRYFPIAVFAGCVLFTILHAVSGRLTEKSAQPAGKKEQPTEPRGSTADKAQAAVTGAHGETKNASQTESFFEGHHTWPPSTHGEMKNATPPATIELPPYQSSPNHQENRPDDTHPAPVVQAALFEPTIKVTWSKQLFMLGNPAAGATQQPCLAGRLEIYPDHSGKAEEANGEVFISVFDQTSVKGHGRINSQNEQPVQTWRLDLATLKTLEQRDPTSGAISYVFYLPFANYHPSIQKVSLTVTYEPAHGTGLGDTSNPFELDASAAQKWKPVGQ